MSWSNYQTLSNVTHVLNSYLIALQNNNVKIKIPFQNFFLLIAKFRTLLNFSSKTDRCNPIANKIHERINYQPIQIWNVSIHPKEHIEVNNIFLNLSFSELGLKVSIYFAKLQAIIISKRSCIHGVKGENASQRVTKAVDVKLFINNIPTFCYPS